MRSIIYSRVSSSKNGQKPDRQINELKEIPGYTVVKTFSESVSGFTRPIEERTELQRAISYAKENDIEVILVHEVSRLGRRTHEILAMLNQLKEDGIKVFVKSLGLLINGDGPAEIVNRLITTLMVDLSRLEIEQLSYRIKSGLEERKRKGYSIGRQYGTSESAEKFLSKHRPVIRYLQRGESIRWISNHLSMSPTTIMKVKNKLKDVA